MGKKYIIELEENPFTNTELSFEDEEPLWRVKGFRSLVFDRNGLSKLQTLAEATTSIRDEAFRRGYKLGRDDSIADLKYKNRLKVGDEIIWDDDQNGIKAVVLDIDDDTFTELNENGCVDMQVFGGGGYSKTGRHFDEVEKLLEAISK